MKTFLNILFVYIPFVICILVVAALLIMLYGEDANGIATIAKYVFPALFLASIIFHYAKMPGK